MRCREPGGWAALAVRWTVVCAALLPPSALAWPVDHAVRIVPGDAHFERLAAVDWVDVESPDVLTAEVLPSGELLLTGLKEGHTHLLLYAEGKFAVWRVQVGGPPSAGEEAPKGPELAAAEKACGLKGETLLAATRGQGPVRVTLATDGCRRALLKAFEHPAFRARQVEVVYELAALQAQLEDLQAALEAAGLEEITLRYKGAGLVMEGTVPEAALRKALWIVFRRSVGRVPLDDQTRRATPPESGGVPAQAAGG